MSKFKKLDYRMFFCRLLEHLGFDFQEAIDSTVTYSNNYLTIVVTEKSDII